MRRVLAALDVTQCELAKDAGIPQSVLCRFLNGHRDLPAWQVRRLFDVLGQRAEAEQAGVDAIRKNARRGGQS